jgi:hypothetical protein
MTRLQLAVFVNNSVAARSVTSSYGDTKNTEQLGKSSGSNASNESSRRGIETKFRVRIGGDLMVDLIEIAKPLTRLKLIRQSQRRGEQLLFAPAMPGIPEILQESSRRRRGFDFLLFVGVARNLGKGLAGCAFRRRDAPLHPSAA